MIKNPYFKENIRIKIENLNEKLLSIQQKTYNLDYIKNNLNKFDNINENILNLFQLMNNENINKLCLLNVGIIFIEYINKNINPKNLKQIEIQNSYLKLFIESKIIYHDLEELNIHINDNFKYNANEIFNIFPNISILILYIHVECDLFEIIKYLNNLKIKTLHIYFECDEFIPFKTQVVLEKIENLKLDINQNILTQLFNYIQIPNLKNYQLNMNGLSKMNKEEINLNKDEFNSINMFLNEILKNKNQFIS